jgi:hypothetical protein
MILSITPTATPAAVPAIAFVFAICANSPRGLLKIGVGMALPSSLLEEKPEYGKNKPPVIRKPIVIVLLLIATHPTPMTTSFWDGIVPRAKQ